MLGILVYLYGQKNNVRKYIKEQLEKINPNHKNEVNLETIKFISNYIIENNDKFDKMIEFNKACERLQKLRAEEYYD